MSKKTKQPIQERLNEVISEEPREQIRRYARRTYDQYVTTCKEIVASNLTPHTKKRFLESLTKEMLAKWESDKFSEALRTHMHCAAVACKRQKIRDVE